MSATRIALTASALVGAVLLTGCAGDYGYGTQIGYGAPGYYDQGYYDQGYYDGYVPSDYAYGGGYYGGGYYGWYNGFFYPGTGIYVYDRYRRSYRWNDGQRRYWSDRGHGYRGSRSTNWGGFDHGPHGFRGAPGSNGGVNPSPGGFHGSGFHNGGSFRGRGGSFHGGGHVHSGGHPR